MRLDSLTGLRWWAAFAVFCYHMMNFAPVPGLGAVARYGNHGVAFFFVLSGFVLTWSAGVSGTTVANFYWRRFARIYPAHVVALLVAIPVFYSVTSATPDPSRFWVKPFAVAPLLLSLVLLQSWFKDPSIRFSGNPAAWTLGVEAFFYALHPWLSRLLARVSRRGALLALGAVTAFVTWSVLLRRYGWAGPWSVWAQNLELQVLAVLFALTILGIANNDLAQRRSWLRHRVLVTLGTWSFAFYLVHATVMYAVSSAVGLRPMSVKNLLWYPVVFALALAAAWALYRFVEHPVERRLRHWGNAHLG